MRDFLSRFFDIISTAYAKAVGPARRLDEYARGLPSGDKAILGVLGVLVGVASLMAAYALERSFLVVEPAYGGTLVEGVVGSPRFVNPLLALSDSDRDLAALTYAGLMGEDAGGNLVPVLAEGYTVSADGKTYTFTLRPDAEFSDGTPVTSADVVYTVQKAQDSALKSPEYANWTGVAASAPDARTIVFTLNKPYAPFLENTTLGILPARLWQGVSDDQFPFSNLNTKPVGAGPFVAESVARDASGIITGYTLAANKHYVLGRPYLGILRFAFYSEESDLADAVKDGAVASAYGVPSASALQSPYSRVFGVFFNSNENPVFAHKEVREALSLALDRDYIANTVLGGYATPLAGPVPPGSGVTEAAVPEASIKDAAGVLEDAGWEYDADAREWTLPSTKETLTVTLKTSNVPELKAVATAVKAEWEALGVPVDVELYEPGDLTQNVIRPRDYGALLFGMVVGRDRDLYAFWDSKEVQDPGLNIAMYSNAKVDSLLEKARIESDPSAVTDDLDQIESLVAADYPAAFTHAPDFLYTVPADLKGVELPQITAPSDRFASVAHWYLRTEAVWPVFARSR
jgi:peptide/nickel transport system substrate-binding protein